MATIRYRFGAIRSGSEEGWAAIGVGEAGGAGGAGGVPKGLRCGCGWLLSSGVDAYRAGMRLAAARSTL